MSKATRIKAAALGVALIVTAGFFSFVGWSTLDSFAAYNAAKVSVAAARMFYGKRPHVAMDDAAVSYNDVAAAICHTNVVARSVFALEPVALPNGAFNRLRQAFDGEAIPGDGEESDLKVAQYYGIPLQVTCADLQKRKFTAGRWAARVLRAGSGARAAAEACARGYQPSDVEDLEGDPDGADVAFSCSGHVLQMSRVLIEPASNV